MAKFHVRARTVDMLGRQQIAGIPTAISELFKNAHDAYAKNVEADYFREEDLLVLRDDGLGMTREDFESRWLTLGTDSKLSNVAGLTPPPKDPFQDERPILGEKGIGRLAVAILGPQLFVLSRARINGKPSDEIVGAYLNWNLFAQPGLDLDEIEIPVREFSVNRLPDKFLVKEMVEEFATCLEKLSHKLTKLTINEIQAEMASFELDPKSLLDELGSPQLTGQGAGTHFFIKPVDRIIQEDIDFREDDNKATKFEKHLLGFTNTMTPKVKRPPLVARFRDYPDERSAIELIGDTAFFTPDEYKQVDHHIHGKFDEYGQFQGAVGIYQTKPESYVLSWAESDGQETLCGPFDFSVAVIQGNVRDSLLPPEEFARMSRKAYRHGGIYVFRDGVRVQPYGDSDYDWLDIERRRTLGAGYYFYSYRRLFGAIELSKHANSALREKAGREGFIENKAYRQFRSILVNFFIQSAADFFREEGKRAEGWEQGREELQKNHRIRQQKAKQATSRRKNLSTSLDAFFKNLDEASYETEAKEALRIAKGKCKIIVDSNRKASDKALSLLRVEKVGREAIDDIRKKISIARPRGVGLTKNLSNQWAAYLDATVRLEEDCLVPIENEIEDFVTVTATNADIPIKDFARISATVQTQTTQAMSVIRRFRKETEESVSQIAKLARDTSKESFRNVSEAIDQILEELELLKRSKTDPSSLTAKRKEFQERIGEVLKHEQDRLSSLKSQFDSLHQFWAIDGYDNLELTEAMEEELVELREQRDADLEMAQIGMAVNIISHEFEKTVTTLRNGFRRLEAWAIANPDLENLYKNMRTSFEHLDAYLAMFTPLDRRIHPERIKILGDDIYNFVRDLFEKRLDRHAIRLVATEKFLKFELTGYPSTFYPVFANLLDNSIFWLQRNRGMERNIILDVSLGEMTISDTGPGVSERDRLNIFLPRFSRKPGGRGMGLHISRATLKKEGFDLVLDDHATTKLSGAVFRIKKMD